MRVGDRQWLMQAHSGLSISIHWRWLKKIEKILGETFRE